MPQLPPYYNWTRLNALVCVVCGVCDEIVVAEFHIETQPKGFNRWSIRQWQQHTIAIFVGRTLDRHCIEILCTASL